MLTRQQQKELEGIVVLSTQALNLSMQYAQQIFLNKLIAFSKNNKWFDMMHLENTLRVMDVPIFLVALSREFWLANTIPSRPHDKTETQYALHLHFGSRQGFLYTLQDYNSSEEENNRRLADCGLSHVNPDTEASRMAKGATGYN